MPAEWEPLERVWVTRPHNPQTWPGGLDRAQRQFDQMLEKIRPHAQPCTTQSVGITTDDSWIRDYGPIFVVNDGGGLACHDFVFNCWGDKYRPYDHDDAVPPQIASRLNIPVWQHRLVLEGGSIDVNGAGTVMTTRQCLLNTNRNPHLTQPQIEEQLHDALGTTHVIWLPGGIAGDDTDGHIDDVARFVNRDTVVAVRAPSGHPDHDVLQCNWRALENAHDQSGAKLNLVNLPAPDPIEYDFPPDDAGPGGPRRLPASYANFLIANSGVCVPVFGQHHDDVALSTLDTAMPDHAIVPIRCEHLVVGLGAVHCLTMQQPRRT